MSNELPIGWNILELGDLGEFRNGANFNKSQFGVGLPIVNVKNLYQSRYASINDLDQLKPDALSNSELVS